jgi:hypothetical protein
MCSGSFIYLLDMWGTMEEVTGGQVNSWLASGLSPGSEGSGGDKSTGLFPEITIKEIVFLYHEYYIREAENLCSSKWHCLDFIWSIINHIYPFSSHFDFIKSQKFEMEFVIWKGSQSPNQVKMTQYSIFYCIIDQNGLKKSEVTKTAVLWSHCHESQLIYQSNDLLSTARLNCDVAVDWRTVLVGSFRFR